MAPERDKISIVLLQTVPAYRGVTKMSPANFFNCRQRSPPLVLLKLGENFTLGVFHLLLENSRRKLNLPLDKKRDLL
jgi:hypothetical protein